MTTMYSRSVRNTSLSNGLSRHRYFRPRFVTNRARVPWYSNPRYRPSVIDRDRRFRDWLRERLRERERINREEDSEDTDEEEIEQPEVPEITRAEKLHVDGIELHIGENTQKHHTDMYECTENRLREGEKIKAELVIRRGQAFLMTVNFKKKDQPYDVKKNDLTLIFSLNAGEHGTKKQTFKVIEGKDTSYRPKKWGANIVKNDGKSVTLEVFSPPSAPVGEWGVSVRTIVDVKDGKDLIWQYNHNEDITIIFNPWCKEDVVYMPDQTWLNEAVLNDDGAVYFGTYRQIGYSSWYYGQFEDGILEAAVHLVRRGFGFQGTSAMGNAARVARVLSSIVNSPDDNGVLVGNWSDDFSGGVRPTKWNGSVKILHQYMKTAKPVKYAQCWVYSAVLTTVCRALGLPCRSVTNFASAHNTDKDHLSHDVIYKKNASGTWVETNESNDSVWNFHVWNDVWMSRPDLGREFDGWQAIDATPQEKSDGVFCCGPAPLKAIKEGLINIGKDTEFVFAEVNADKVTWHIDPVTKAHKLMSRDPHAVGKRMSTHEPTGGPLVGEQRLDVTDQYKYPDGTDRERQIVRKAERMFRHDNIDDDEEAPPPVKPVEVTIEDQDGIYVGSSFSPQVVVVNSSDSKRTVELSIKVSHKTYFGLITGTAAQDKYKEILAPGERKSFVLDVSAKVALMRPKEGFHFNIQAVAEVAETDNIVTETSSFRLRRPDIEIEGPSRAKVGEAFDIEVSFTNPLPLMLTNVEIEIAGKLKPVPASADHLRIGNIRRGQTWKRMIKVSGSKYPRKKEQTVNFGLESDQLGDIIGKHTVKFDI